ncbi:hypothetical protein R3P38DRAFT_3039552 [Favolaschia claudopus]|uniref:Gustatory receptor n=1 Tax=Favolaschia claudopus TaxID=2862362 RepID=A0AAW0AA96_9AGAR
MAPPASVPLGRIILYLTVGLVVQTLFFGAYTIIILLSTRMLMRRGLKTRANRILFALTLFMYLLSTSYWVYRIADLVSRINFLIAVGDMNSLLSAPNPTTRLFTLFNALTLLNYLLCDGFVIWRALICSPSHRKFLYFAIFLLTLMSLAVVSLIGLRIGSTFVPNFEKKMPSFTPVIDALQLSALGLSVVSNFISTGVVWASAWQHRKAISGGFNKTTKGDQILRILLESGIFYTVSAVFGLGSILIRLPYNTLGDLFTPVSIQIAGAYTPIVLLLISTKKSLSDPTFLGTVPDALKMPSIEERSPATTLHAVQFGVPALGPLDFEKDNRPSHRYQLSEATLV